MPQPIANNTGNPISGSIERADMSLAIEGEGRDYRGNYSGLEWYSSITPIDGKYVIVSKSVGTGLPTHWVTADATDAELLYTVNRLPDVANSQTFNDTGSALDYLANSDRYIVLRSMPDQIDADSMVLNLDAGLESSYPRTGTTWYDLSGRGDNVTSINGAIFDSKKGFEFDGTDDYMQINSTVDLGNPCTVTALVNVESVGSYVIYGPSANGHDNWLGTNGTQLEMFGTQTADTNNFTVRGNSLVCDGTRWHHVACTIDGATAKVWIDGNEKNSTTRAFEIGGWDSTAGIGRRGFISQRYFPGRISKIQGYNKALSSDEMKQNYFGGPIITDGLIFAVDPSNLVSYESGSTTTYSLTGSYTGSLQNGVGFRPDNGGVFYFDGGDDIISSQNVNPSAITVEVWKKWTTVSDDWLITNQVAPTNSSYGYYIRIDSPSYALRWYAGTTSGVKVAATTIDLNEWYHVVGMTDADGTKLYVNGELVGSDTGGTIDYTGVQGLTIGAANDTSRATPGPVGAVRIYDRALTAEEVAQNYNAQKQKYQS